MYRLIWLSLTLLIMSSSVLAEGCVSGIAVVAARHSESAVGEIVFVNTYSSIAACNESLNLASKNPLSHPMPEGAAPFASFTFVCKVPTDCSPSDAGLVLPFHKVIRWTK